MTQSIKKGFTLIEMLIVIVIIGILAGVLIPKIGGAREKAEDIAIKANVKALSQAMMQYEMGGNKIESTTTLEVLSGATNEAKYGAPSLGDDADKYSMVVSGTKYMICGDVSDDANGNSNSTGTYSNTFNTTGSYYCISY